MSTSVIITCMLVPQVYLACKHKKLHTQVAAMTLQRLPGTEAMSAFEIPNTKEAKLICQDPWVSMAITIITILGIIVYLYKTCSKMSFLRDICMIMYALFTCSLVMTVIMSLSS